MEVLKIFLIGVALTLAFMFGIQLFARWKTGKIVGKELPKSLGKDVVLYFYSPKCGACVKMEPVIDSLSRKVKVKRFDISTEEGLELARQLGVLGTPTTMIVKDSKVKRVFLGYQKEEKILKEV